VIKDKTELRKDGQRTLEGGMNSGRDPTLLSPQECSYSNNVTFRGGFPSNRQIFQKRTLIDVNNLLSFITGLFQGAAIYDIDDGQEYIMAMVGGFVLFGLMYLLVGPLFWRIYCELLILLFRMYDELQAIRGAARDTMRPIRQPPDLIRHGAWSIA